MANGHQRIKKLRERLFRAQRGLCYWCKQPMVLNPRKIRHQPDPPNMCTLEHLHDRFSPLRGVGEKKNVVACKKCNNERGARNQAAIAREELHRRSQRP